MNVHFIIHQKHCGPGFLAEYLMEKEATLSFTKVWEGDEIPQEPSWDMLIIMGGGMNVGDVADYPWISDELGLIRKSINRRVKVLGICLGAQLIAKALGGTVQPNEEWEIGWWPISRTDWGDMHSLTKQWPMAFSTFQWHGQTFSLPEGAVQLCKSFVCENQAFIYHDHVIGFQFHPEATEYVITDFLKNSDEDLANEGRYVGDMEQIFSQTQYAVNHDVCRTTIDYLMAS